MTVFPSYSTGTVSVADGGTTVTGSGSNWSDTNVMPGDTLQIGEFQTIISDVTDTTHLVIPPWGGGAQSGASYKIWQTSVLRSGGIRQALNVDRLIEVLNTTGFFVFVAPSLTEPDPSLGEEGQFALQPSTGIMWEKSGGVWVSAGTFRGFGTPAPWSGATAYEPYDIASLDGTSYICILGNTNHTPPNATYWVELAGKGDTGPTGPAAWTAPAAWLTATAYVAGPPASVVVQGGETYVCLTSHTSGTFATDLAAAKWIKVAQKGTGDMLAANNLSDLANGHTALKVTLNGVSFGTPQSLSDGEKAQARSNIFKGPTTQVFTSGSGTYTTPTDCLWIEVRMVGGGGGGAGGGTSPGSGGAGGNTTFSSFTASGGGNGSGGAAGNGGAATGGSQLFVSGGDGSPGQNNLSGVASAYGGSGGSSILGGSGKGGFITGAGSAGKTNSGGGGGGGGVSASASAGTPGGGGGGAGGGIYAVITSPASSYSYSVGAAGTAGTAGTNGGAGGAGGAGFIQVTEHYV